MDCVLLADCFLEKPLFFTLGCGIFDEAASSSKQSFCYYNGFYVLYLIKVKRYYLRRSSSYYMT